MIYQFLERLGLVRFIDYCFGIAFGLIIVSLGVFTAFMAYELIIHLP